MMTDTLDLANPTREWINIILVARSGRRQENFLALLRSIPNSPTISCAQSMLECVDILHASLPTLIILDHVDEKDGLAAAMSSFHRRNHHARVLLLADHPRENFTVYGTRPDAILCDGFSFSALMEEVRRVIST